MSIMLKRAMRLLALLAAGLYGSSCSVQNRYVETELYFGLSLNNGNTITDSAWNIFVEDHVSKVFSNGFTLITSEGKWMDEQYKLLHAEPSRIVIAVNKMNTQLSGNIDSLRNTYKQLFNQEAVLRVDKKAEITW